MTDEQFAYGAIIDFAARWSAVRRAVHDRRPRQRGAGMLAALLTAAMGHRR